MNLGSRWRCCRRWWEVSLLFFATLFCLALQVRPAAAVGQSHRSTISCSDECFESGGGLIGLANTLQRLNERPPIGEELHS